MTHMNALQRIGRQIKWTAETIPYLGLLDSIHFWQRNRPRVGGGTLTIEWPTAKYPIRLRSTLSDLRTFRHVMIEQGYRCPYELSPSVIFDLGAHVGLSTIWFASTYPDAQIICVEPVQENYQLLVENVRDFPNVTPVRAAILGESGSVQIAGDPSMADSYRIQPSTRETNQEAFWVPVVTIDDLMERFEVSRIDLLKIDIEGSEVEVFSSAKAWIHHVSVIAIELHDRHRPGCTEAFDRGIDGILSDRVEQSENTFVRRIGSAS